LISTLPGETRAAWLEDDRLVDLVIQRADRPSLLGNFYHGRVTKVDKRLDAAFVEIGLSRAGLLPLSEAERRLAEGDAVIVKLLREAQEQKGPRLTARIFNPPRGLRDQARVRKPPALLAMGDDPIDRTLAAGAEPDEIVVDDPETFALARDRLAARDPKLVERLRQDLDPLSLFERAGVETEIEALLEPRVELASGAFLLIEPVRTLTAIDVNSGRHEGRGSQDDQARAINLEAAAEIPRQLRLRALSGLIAIDFLAMSSAAARRTVSAALRQGLKQDPEPARVLGMSESGLAEVTRRRGRPALHEILTEPCGLGGLGRVKDPVTLAFEALRSARREAASRPGGTIVIEAAPAIIRALQGGPAASARRVLEKRLGRAFDMAEAK